jgi:hypothetical protein
VLTAAKKAELRDWLVTLVDEALDGDDLVINNASGVRETGVSDAGAVMRELDGTRELRLTWRGAQ